jgi:hypothetical protein
MSITSKFINLRHLALLIKTRGGKMKKIVLLISVLLSILLVLGCSSKQKCWQREISYTENQESKSSDCQNSQVTYEISNIKSDIKPYPSEAKHDYDVGIVDFSLLNKDKKVNGYFNVSIECVMPKGNTIEKTEVYLAAGEVKPVRLMCSQRGTITKINGPLVDLAPTTQVCMQSTTQAPVQKVRYETVCE